MAPKRAVINRPQFRIDAAADDFELTASLGEKWKEMKIRVRPGVIG